MINVLVVLLTLGFAITWYLFGLLISTQEFRASQNAWVVWVIVLVGVIGFNVWYWT